MKKSKTKTAHKQVTKTAKALLPLQAAALAHFSDPEVAGVNRQFLEAYAAIPPLVAKIIDEGNRDGVYTLIEKLSGLTAAERRAKHGKGDADEDMVQAVKALYAADEGSSDLLVNLATPLMINGFVVGLAFASYVLLEKGGVR